MHDADAAADAERPVEELARAITAGAVRLAAATAAWLGLIAEFDAREGWAGYGIRSCAHWLSWQCGLSPNAAREHVRVARALRHLPAIATAFGDGRLSYAKVRALTRVAEPATEEALLEFAVEATASQIERTVREWRRADRRAGAEDAVDEDGAEPTHQAPREEFDAYWDDDGMLVLRARLSVDNGAPFLAGITSLVERAARRDRAAARSARNGEVGSPAPRPADDGDDLQAAREATTARRCAALAALARAAADADRRAGDPPRREVTVHVDAAVLADDAAAGRAYVEGGPALTATQARRMLCEATVITMLEADREVLAVGRARRLAGRAQRRALLRRDGGCARPGCPESRLERLHAHHMRHWLFGGRTDLSNLVLLCDADHGLAHDLDLVLSRRDGRLVAVTPDGRRVWGPADAAFAPGLGDLDRCEGIEGAFTGVHPMDTARGRRPAGGTRRRPSSGSPTLDAPAAEGGGAPAATISRLLFPAGEPELPAAVHVNGERMDLAYAVSVLMGHRDFVHRMAAETGVGRAA